MAIISLPCAGTLNCLPWYFCLFFPSIYLIFTPSLLDFFRFSIFLHLSHHHWRYMKVKDGWVVAPAGTFSYFLSISSNSLIFLLTFLTYHLTIFSYLLDPSFLQWSWLLLQLHWYGTRLCICRATWAMTKVTWVTEVDGEHTPLQSFSYQIINIRVAMSFSMYFIQFSSGGWWTYSPPSHIILSDYQQPCPAAMSFTVV